MRSSEKELTLIIKNKVMKKLKLESTKQDKGTHSIKKVKKRSAKVTSIRGNESNELMSD
jgi:hypothetical protein